MYVILVYDMGQERVAKMLKLCRQYLHWIQNSVFEGQLTEAKLQELIQKAKEIMDINYDSLIIFSNLNQNWLQKEVIGKERSSTSMFL